MPGGDGGLGSALVGEKVSVGETNLIVSKLLGEGGFSYVYMVKEIGDSPNHAESYSPEDGKKIPLVLKVTSIHSRAQRDIAEKEAKLLSRLSHPSIIKMYDKCYRQAGSTSQGKGKGSTKERPQHLILMEFCEGGHALDVCNKLAAKNQKFDLPTLIIAFGQICNAVSYLHAQKPPIVHRDLKPVNFLVKSGAYKLCDFGSAIFGHVDLRTQKARAEAEDEIQKTTTQMFRAPEMVDLYMAKKLTQATDVWALGCCLYSMAFLQNCFEEGSNLAILSGKYTVPDDNPYGDGLVELLDRMLTFDSKARADMTEVILCLSAVYSGKPLPERKRPSRVSKSNSQDKEANQQGNEDTGGADTRVGSYRLDGQGYQQPVYDPTKATEGKKLASNSVAARRKRAAASNAPVDSSVPPSGQAPSTSSPADPLAFSSFADGGEKTDTLEQGNDVSFGEMKGFETKEGANEAAFFGSFDNVMTTATQSSGDGFDSTFQAGAWGSSDPPEGGVEVQLESSYPSDNRLEDPQQHEKVRGKRGEGEILRQNRAGEVENGMENMRISEEEGLKSRRHRSTRPEDEIRRSGGSKSGRNSRHGKPRSGRDIKDMTLEDSGNAQPSSFKKKSNQRSRPPDP